MVKMVKQSQNSLSSGSICLISPLDYWTPLLIARRQQKCGSKKMGIGRLLMYPFYENGVLKKEFGFLNICASRYH